MNHVSGYTVVLDRDIAEESAKKIEHALRMIIGVIDVQPHNAEYEQQVADSRAKTELGMLMWETLKPIVSIF